jgi:hypothetical protein
MLLAAVLTGPSAVAIPCAKCRSRTVFGVSRVRIAVRRTSSSTPSTGLYQELHLVFRHFSESPLAISQRLTMPRRARSA